MQSICYQGPHIALQDDYVYCYYELALEVLCQLNVIMLLIGIARLWVVANSLLKECNEKDSFLTMPVIVGWPVAQKRPIKDL